MMSFTATIAGFLVYVLFLLLLSLPFYLALLFYHSLLLWFSANVLSLPQKKYSYALRTSNKAAALQVLAYVIINFGRGVCIDVVTGCPKTRAVLWEGPVIFLAFLLINYFFGLFRKFFRAVNPPDECMGI